MIVNEKYEKLKTLLREMRGVVIGFSGGVDSALLLAIAAAELKDKALGVIAVSVSYPERELDDARRLAREIGARVEIVHTDEEEDHRFVDNPANRCYYCRSALYRKMAEIAQKESLPYLADGTNLDDEGDYRPGMKAQTQYSVRSPLREAGFRKADIRELAKRLGLTCHDKPALACLASRIPYGSSITKEKLGMVDRAETVLRELGFKTVRVRHYDETARIEVGTAELTRLLDGEIRKNVVHRLQDIGYLYVTLDLEGFRSGSMNKVLKNRHGKSTGEPRDITIGK